MWILFQGVYEQTISHGDDTITPFQFKFTGTQINGPNSHVAVSQSVGESPTSWNRELIEHWGIYCAQHGQPICNSTGTSSQLQLSVSGILGNLASCQGCMYSRGPPTNYTLGRKFQKEVTWGGEWGASKLAAVRSSQCQACKYLWQMVPDWE